MAPVGVRRRIVGTPPFWRLRRSTNKRSTRERILFSLGALALPVDHRPACLSGAFAQGICPNSGARIVQSPADRDPAIPTALQRAGHAADQSGSMRSTDER